MIQIQSLGKQFQNETQIAYRDITFETGRSYMLLGASGCRKEPEVVQTLPPVTEAPETTAAPETTEAVTEPTETEPAEEHFTLTLVGDCTLGYMPGHEYSYGGFKYIVGEDYEYPFRNVLKHQTLLRLYIKALRYQ